MGSPGGDEFERNESDPPVPGLEIPFRTQSRIPISHMSTLDDNPHIEIKVQSQTDSNALRSWAPSNLDSLKVESVDRQGGTLRKPTLGSPQDTSETLRLRAVRIPSWKSDVSSHEVIDLPEIPDPAEKVSEDANQDELTHEN